MGNQDLSLAGCSYSQRNILELNDLLFRLSTQSIKVVPSLQAVFFFCRGAYKRMCKNVNWEKVLANRLPLEGIDQSHLFYSLSGEARVKYSPFRDLLYHCEDSYLLPQKAEIRLAACITFASWQMLCCLLFRLKKNSNVSTLILNPLVLVLCLVGLGWVFLLF